MAKDAELERLKALQDQAFRRKQDAHQAQQRAWEKRSSARDTMNRAFEAQDRAFTSQQAAWEDFSRVKASLGPQIDSLNAQQEQAYRDMGNSFDRASSAHARGDGAGAASHAADGHRHREESQRCVAKRRELVEQIRMARSRLKPYQLDFQRAKDEFARAKTVFTTAKAEHERAQAEFDQAVKAFQDRLAKVKAENKKRRDDKRSIAERAGVPMQYRDNVWVSKQSDGTTNIYFGGVGKPDGPGHGHYVMDRSGTVTYSRDPFDPHGAHNFKSNQADYFDAVRTESISGTDEFGFRCTYKGMPATVETGYDDRTGRQKINIYYGAPGGTIGRGHGHAVAYRDAPFTIVSDRLPR